VCWKSCSSCWSLYLLRKEFLSVPIRSPLSDSPFWSFTHSSASKKRNKDDSDFDSEEEVNNDLSFLIAENARLNDLLDNRYDVLRKTYKEKREYRSLLGEAKEKVVKLESLLVDARAQIDSLNSTPVVTNEPECSDFPV
jgi:hypothetical protein